MAKAFSGKAKAAPFPKKKGAKTATTSKKTTIKKGGKK